MALTVDDYERAYYVSILGVSALPTDSINDLRYKFYKGVYEGSIVIGGGGGGVEQGTFDGSASYGLSFPDASMTARIDTDVFPLHNKKDYYYFKVPKPVRLRKIGRDFYSITGTPTGAVRYAIYNAVSPIKIGTLFSGTAPIATFSIANGFSVQTIDITLPAGGYFLVNHNDFSGLTAVSQRKFYAANRLYMASEQTAYTLGDAAPAAWPGSWATNLFPTLSTASVSGLIAATPGTLASAALGWDAA